MTDPCFNAEMSVLKECFPRGFTDDKVKIIYDISKHLTDKSFSDICKKIVTTSKHAPTVADFQEHVNAIPRLVKNINGSCIVCNNGLITATNKENGGLYSFKCPCDIGLQRNETYPIWQQHHGASYEKD
jgi:hypothetical protein